MPRVDDGADGPGLVVPGLYRALLARERDHQARHDEFVESTGWRRRYGRNRRVLDALESGRPAIVQGRNLSGWGIPKVSSLRREDAFRWFAVTPDDRVVLAESPETD